MGAVYTCCFSRGGQTADAKVTVEKEGVSVTMGKAAQFLDFADIRDMRLLNYRLHLYLWNDEAVFSMLGRETENFFNTLWSAYDARTRAALFLNGAPVQECEGDYRYTENGETRSSIARLALYPDCLCILPHDAGARRVPLCFANPPAPEQFALVVSLDTGERYRLARLGREMTPFFERLCKFRTAAAGQWANAHAALDRDFANRPGFFPERYQAMARTGMPVIRGLFSAEDDAFWYAAVGSDRAAVELVIGESAATYLYRFNVAPQVFAGTLRHAMEAVGSHREVIYTPVEELAQKPLLRMAVQRSMHVRFLRQCSAGRLMHTSGWEAQLQAFFR